MKRQTCSFDSFYGQRAIILNFKRLMASAGISVKITKIGVEAAQRTGAQFKDNLQFLSFALFISAGEHYVTNLCLVQRLTVC